MSNSQRKLELETRAVLAIKTVLSTMTDDDIAIRDCIEGECNLHEAIRRVYWNVIEDQILTDGLKETITTLEGRKSRIDARIERYRAAIAKGMEAGELQKLEMPEATLSLRNNGQKVDIYDEAAIPEGCLIPQPPKVDKAKVKALLSANENIPGARLSNGGVSLSVRRA